MKNQDKKWFKLIDGVPDNEEIGTYFDILSHDELLCSGVYKIYFSKFWNRKLLKPIDVVGNRKGSVYLLSYFRETKNENRIKDTKWRYLDETKTAMYQLLDL